MSENLPTIYLGEPGEEISQKDLFAIAERFKKLHLLKRESIRRVLNTSQRQFLDALPLILNANHPALPGYISSDTPAGIFAYIPDKQAIDAARQLNQSFNHQPRKLTHHNDAIDGLFLMGSVGSIAFTKASDVDIWLCHRTDLTVPQLDELQKKTHALEKWAASLHLEVHFFLIDSNQFLLAEKTPVSVDSSGETQHYLLLEEFYRTSVYIAGKMLAWWLVPPEHENDYERYLAHLLEGRFIRENQILDLGGLAHVPANEFISSTLWHIYKALQSPYKSLMKLSLLECYAKEYPSTKWLCVDIKRAVYQGKLTGLEIDPYVLLYRKLEDYLQKTQNHEKLAMIRQIFCRKVTEAAGDGAISPYEAYFREMSDRWRGSDNAVNFPCHEPTGDFAKLLIENAAIVRQLTSSHHLIKRFAHDHIDPDFQENSDTRLLARKLLAFFERKRGKIEMTTIRGNGLTTKPSLAIIENQLDAFGIHWNLFIDQKSQSDSVSQGPLYGRPTLIELLSWLSVNGYYRHGTPIHCDFVSLNLAPLELNTILDCLNAFFKRHFDSSDSLANYEEDNHLICSTLIINMGQMPPDNESAHYVISNRGNPLSHGAKRECLVRTVERVSISHWHEVLSSHEAGIVGLLNCLIEIINETKQPVTSDCLTVVCQTPGHAHNIIQRVEKLFETLLSLHRTDPSNKAPRYLMAGGDRYFIVSKQDSGSRLQYRQIDNEAQLIKTLTSARAHYGSVAFDAEVLAQTPIPTIYQENRPNTVQCFVYQETDGARAYIVDENGSLYIRHHPGAAPKQLISHYGQFLQAVLSRTTADAEKMEFFELKKNAAGVWSYLPRSYHRPKAQVQSGLDMALPKPGVAEASNLQTLHFLEHKEQIEARLNRRQN